MPVCSLEAVTPGTEQKHNITGGIQNPSTVERISTRAVDLSRAVLGEREEARGYDEEMLRLRAEHHVYMLESGRLSMAGVTSSNVEPLAAAIAAVL